jgi:hypothetical protein
MKKHISLFMAIAMIFALAVPAFAAATPGESTVNVAGGISAPTIEIEAPSEASLVLNPYRMVYNGEIKALKDSQDAILSLPGVYVNKTDVDLMIEVTATANPSANITLSDTAVADTETAKKVELKFAFGEMSDKDGASFATNSTNHAAAAIDTSKKVELKKTDSTDTRLKMAATDGKTPNYFGFQFSGSATPNPTTAWDTSDKIDVAVVVKATPIALTVSSS